MRELQKIDVEGFVGSLGDIVYDLPFQLPQSLLFLGRAVGVVGGVATGLAPDFDVFATTRPFALRFIRERGSGRDIRERLATEGRELLIDLSQLPHRATEFYSRAARGDLQVSIDQTKTERATRAVERAVIRLAVALAGAALLISSAILQHAGVVVTWMWWLAGGLLVWALWPRPSWLR